MIADNLYSNLLAVGVLLALFIIIYCKITKKSLVDLFKELKDGLFKPKEE